MMKEMFDLSLKSKFEIKILTSQHTSLVGLSFWNGFFESSFEKIDKQVKIDKPEDKPGLFLLAA